MRVAGIAIAGALGALARYGIARAAGTTRNFPWPTLAINVIGCFALGVLAALAVRGRVSDTAAVVMGTGFLGAFTTFSTFGVETWTLLRTERPGAAAAYVLASVLVGVGAAALGWGAAGLAGGTTIG